MANETPISISGNLTGDPELAFTPAGVARCRFTVASTPRRFDKDAGKWVDGESMFLTCTVWRHAAEHAAESLSKGLRVLVVGRLRQHHWQDDDGQHRSMFGIDVDEVGPSLLFATAKVARATCSNPRTPDDPWSTPPGPGRPTAAAGVATAAGGVQDGAGYSEEPPF